MLKIAYFSPLPPQRSGIADYSAELLPCLAEEAELTLFSEDAGAVSPELRSRFRVCSLTQFPRARWDYDIALYQMGDSMYHEAMYLMLLRYPGITVLHDLGLHHFIATRTIPRGDYAGYVREMGYALGVEGVHWAYEIRQGQRQHPLHEVSLNRRVLDSSLGVIVHSQYAHRRIQASCPGLPTSVVPAPIRGFHGPR